MSLGGKVKHVTGSENIQQHRDQVSSAAHQVCWARWVLSLAVTSLVAVSWGEMWAVGLLLGLVALLQVVLVRWWVVLVLVAVMQLYCCLHLHLQLEKSQASVGYLLSETPDQKG
jgi:hypothetical protein